MQIELELEFERLIRFAEANIYPKTFRARVLEGLRFFKQATSGDSSCSPDALRLRWQEFEIQLRGTGLLERLQREAGDWKLIQHFIEGHETKNVHALALKRSPYAKWDVDRLFRHLLHAAQASDLRGLERFAVLIALKYLIGETEKPAHRRECKWIAPTWRYVHPILQKKNLLMDFSEEEQLRLRLAHFIRGG